MSRSSERRRRHLSPPRQGHTVDRLVGAREAAAKQREAATSIELSVGQTDSIVKDLRASQLATLAALRSAFADAVLDDLATLIAEPIVFIESVTEQPAHPVAEIFVADDDVEPSSDEHKPAEIVVADDDVQPSYDDHEPAEVVEANDDVEPTRDEHEPPDDVGHEPAGMDFEEEADDAPVEDAVNPPQEEEIEKREDDETGEDWTQSVMPWGNFFVAFEAQQALGFKVALMRDKRHGTTHVIVREILDPRPGAGGQLRIHDELVAIGGTAIGKVQTRQRFEEVVSTIKAATMLGPVVLMFHRSDRNYLDAKLV